MNTRSLDLVLLLEGYVRTGNDEGYAVELTWWLRRHLDEVCSGVSGYPAR